MKATSTRFLVVGRAEALHLEAYARKASRAAWPRERSSALPSSPCSYAPLHRHPLRRPFGRVHRCCLIGAVDVPPGASLDRRGGTSITASPKTPPACQFDCTIDQEALSCRRRAPLPFLQHAAGSLRHHRGRDLAARRAAWAAARIGRVDKDDDARGRGELRGVRPRQRTHPRSSLSDKRAVNMTLFTQIHAIFLSFPDEIYR